MKRIILSFIAVSIMLRIVNNPVFAFTDLIDDDPGTTTTWYYDSDGDGYGDPNKSTNTNTNPFFYIKDNTDCDDTDATIYPGAKEIAGDGIDQDCDGTDMPALFTGVLKSDVDGGVAPVTVTFYAFVAQGTAPFSYAYNFGVGSTKTAGQKTESHTYKAKGSYTVKATVTDANGTAYELVKTILVTDTTDLDTFQDNLEMDADQMKQTTKPGDMPGLLFDAKNIIKKSLKTSQNADAAVKNKVQTFVKSKAGDLIANTGTQLNSFLANQQPTADELKDISNGLKGVTSGMIENGVPVSEQTFQNMTAISDDLYGATLDSLLANENLTPAQIAELKTDKTKAQTFFQSKHYLMDDVVDSAGISVVPENDVTPDGVNNIASDHSLTDQQTANLYNSVETTLDISQDITDSNLPELKKTIKEVVQELFNTYSSGVTVSNITIDSDTQNILIEFSDSTYMSLVISNIAIVKDYMPKGVFDLPNGNKLGVSDYYAIEFAPYPVFPLDFNAEVIKLGVKPLLGLDGGLQVDTSSQTKMSLKMGWSYLPKNSFNSLTTTFSVIGGSDPSAEAYSLMVTYDTGLSQMMPPSVMAMDLLTTIFDCLFPADYTIDNDTGVITIGTMKIKPDYEFTAKTNMDLNAISAAGGIVVNNSAFEIKDYNGDGKNDYGFYSNKPMGFQILYSVQN